MLFSVIKCSRSLVAGSSNTFSFAPAHLHSSLILSPSLRVCVCVCVFQAPSCLPLSLIFALCSFSVSLSLVLPNTTLKSKAGTKLVNQDKDCVCVCVLVERTHLFYGFRVVLHLISSTRPTLSLKVDVTRLSLGRAHPPSTPLCSPRARLDGHSHAPQPLLRPRQTVPLT